MIDTWDNSKDAIFDTLRVPQHLRNIVTRISRINTYQTDVMGKSVEKPANAENFKKLVQLASEDELLSLINNRNKTVAVYASVGLLERKPELIDKVFSNFLNLKTTIHTQNGCLVGDLNPAEPLYHKYCYSLPAKNRQSDQLLKKLDSIIIFNPNSPKSLLLEVFRYKNFPKNYRKRIETLAFKNHEIFAAIYLSHWHKSDYIDALQKEFISIIKNDTLVGISKRIYLKELLSLRNPANKEFILNYLKKDTLFSDEIEITRELETNDIFPDEYPTR
ncbi:hypothetical protein [Chryseobacterium paridis]|uniref:Uncharacterized protein n=1 Tax=Chryseobacterium paridis TaxID=2800328 RepID=A0ABS1FYU6_9FLAO|nr:hypothetical protein [Chryseobacterium paridis]MBK1897562.1 hypothetical protein [Chryseobacterium paridis]